MQDPKWDQLWVGANLATMTGEGYGICDQGAIATIGDRIAWVGPQIELPGKPEQLAAIVHNTSAGWILPGFIDCHTHLVFAGDRSGEFAQRRSGATYEEIAKSGGGIVSTVRATREASEQELFDQSLPRLRALVAGGVTTVEIKSGYGLDLATELKMLRVAKDLATQIDVAIEATFLGAHTLPPEFNGRSDDYISLVCNEMIPEIASEGIASAVDGFCEGIAFTPEQISRVFDSAKQQGLHVKLHADQLSDLGGAALAANYQALSADHLEYTSEAGVEAMAAAGVVAVLLPGAFYYLGETKKPPIEEFRRQGVPMALATDCNPGSSPVTSLGAVVNMGCNLFGMAPVEAVRAVTIDAAKALGKSEDIGILKAGAHADFCMWHINHPDDLCYWLTDRRPEWVVRSGQLRN